MAHLVKPLIRWPRWLHQYRSSSTFHHLLHSQPPSFITTTPSYRRKLHFRSRGGLRVPNAPPPSDLRDSDSDSDSNAKKSRNEKKREARRAVRWAMDLASFSNSQIKRIIEVASLEEDLFDALVLVKTFGRDVREGKRRQYNYIGRLLRGVQPELMDSLIQATRDGDQSRLQALSGTETHASKDDNDEALETEYEEEEEGSNNSVDTATRWFDGLIAKDIDITKEIYSLHSVEFDRQELRKLVRKVHSTQEHRVTCEENEGQVDAALEGAERALTRFLQAIAKSMPTE